MQLFFKAGLGLLLLAVAGALAGLAYLRFGFPQVSPAPDLRVEATPERLARGAYLAKHVAACLDCHSQRDETRFSSPPVPGTEGQGGAHFGPAEGLPGDFHAPNITPAALAAWTDGEVYRALAVGVNRAGEPYFPIMPYPNYGASSKEDILSLIAYVRTLPARPGSAPPSAAQFPVALIMRTMPRDPQHTEVPPRSDTVAYGAYVARLAGCADCHTPSQQGQPDLTRLYAGGNPFQVPTGGTARAANLTPDPDHGLGRWTKAQFIARFKAYAAPYEAPKVPAGTYNTPMPWTQYAGMTEEDLGALFDFLRSLPPIPQPVVRFTPPADA